MKILVNATNMVVGGTIQKATSFIIEAIKAKDRGLEFYFCVSEAVFETINRLGVENSPWKIEKFKNNPNHPIRGFRERQRLHEVETIFKPDIVYSVSGPIVTKFKALHLCGCGIGTTTHPSKIFYKKMGLVYFFKNQLRKIWDFHFLRQADFWKVQANVARRGLMKGVGTDDEHVRVIANTCARIFLDAPKSEANFGEKEIRLFALGAPYIHKNFDIIPDVLAHLKKIDPIRKYVFTLTLPETCKVWGIVKKRAIELGVMDGVRNLGRVFLSDCPEIYNTNHIVFMPTLLESFSATYPEAMAMRRPIVTSDLDFARDICKTAALYYSPLDSADAACKILQVVENPSLREYLIAEGEKVLGELPSAEGKYKLLVKYMREIVAGQAHCDTA
ncbi:MAG: glycosyltransferase [Opitutae bacterium]|nr:glycosyltransferase [Opitutae bacterium]